MGNKNGDQDEQPVHTVILDSFKMDVHEVTNAEYEQCVKAGKCVPAHYDDNTCNVMTPQGWWEGIAPSVFKDQKKPVVCVNWHEAKQFCEWKNGNLPSEAQWEYAARAGSKSKYIWGDDIDNGCGYANGADLDGAKIFESVWNNLYPQKMNCHDGNAYTAVVKSYKPNNLGLYDMTGNVWEWCGDWYAPRYSSGHKPNDNVNPVGPDTGVYRVLRGGSAESNPDHLTVTYRDRGMPHYRMLYDGFRCVYKP
jgi:formylglycine-generating enzyme required for sulfatase activity